MARIRCPCGNVLFDTSDASPDVLGEFFTKAECDLWSDQRLADVLGETVMQCRECGRLGFTGGDGKAARWFVPEPSATDADAEDAPRPRCIHFGGIQQFDVERCSLCRERTREG